jgi:adenylate cyclase
MPTAEERLALWVALEHAVEHSRSLPEACDALGRFVLERSKATEALVLARGQSERHLRAGGEGSAVLSDELRATARIVQGAGDHWQETRWGDTVARALRLGEGRVGSVLLRRAGGGPSTADLDLLEEIELRSASLLRGASDRATLEDRNLELATIYEIDHIRDERLAFEDMLQRIMGRVLELIPAEGTVVTLRSVHDEDGKGLVNHVRARKGSDKVILQVLEERAAPIQHIVEEAFRERSFLSDRLADDHMRTIACMPLILDEEILGGFLLISPPHQRFSARDERLFRAVCSQTDTAIFEDLQRRRLKDVFKRYVSKDVFEQMLHSEEDFLQGRRADVTCFFSDLRGFTSVSEQLATDVVVDMLNEHLHAMTELVFQHGGTVDKFIGDCVMAFFGAPIPADDHVERAMRCAIDMRKAHQEIAQGWARRGLPDVRIGIGMHTGPVFVGPIGGDKLVSYTIIGDNVNLASRLEGESGPDEIIITSAIADQLKDTIRLEPRGELTVRGKTVPVTIFNVLDEAQGE